MGIEIRRSAELEAALNVKYRQYLLGDPKYPQEGLKCMSSQVEIGISKYDCFTADAPHVHTYNYDFNYVLEGSLKLLLLDEPGVEYEFFPGDFFRLSPNTPYASKSTAGTRVLFVKTPGGNDKVLVDATDEYLVLWRSRY